MASRAYPRLLLALYVIPQLIKRALFGRKKPKQIQRILVIHHLLLGDTLMVSSLLAKLREQYPRAHIVAAVPEAFAGLFKGNPFDIEVLPYNPHKTSSLWKLLRLPRFDIALVPGDNRYGWTAFAMGARWIGGFGGDHPARKSACFDELRLYSSTPMAWTDMITELVDGPKPTPYKPGLWDAPHYLDNGELPSSPYTLVHVGAKSPLKLWPRDHWLALIDQLRNQGHQIVLSCGPGESHILRALKLSSSTPQFYGNLSLGQFWQLLARANLLVCLDNGVGHLARIIGTPTVCLFGPASDLLYGAGEYWGECPYVSVSVAISCRDQSTIFKRDLDWPQTCNRVTSDCKNHICMQAISAHQVLDAIDKLIPDSPPQ